MTSKNLKNFEFRLGRQGFMLFVASMSLLLFLVFILGVMVGMHIDAYPEKIARVMPHLIRKQIERFLAKTEKTVPEEEDVVSRPAGEGGNLPAAVLEPLFPKTEEVKETVGVENNKHPLAPSQPFRNTAGAVVGNKGSLADVEEEEVKPPAAADSEKGRENRPFNQEPTGVSGERKTTAEKKYMLQVVSFDNRKKAEQFCKKIIPLGYNPRVTMVELPKKGRWFRVVIEGFKTEKEARKTADALSEKIKGINCVIRPIK